MRMKKTARVRAREEKRKHKNVQEEASLSQRICYFLLSYKSFFFLKKKNQIILIARGGEVI